MSAGRANTLATESRTPDEGAAFWDSRLRSPLCTDADRTAFASWRAEDPAHAASFEKLQSGLRGLQEAYASSPELRAMRDHALGERAAPPLWRIAASVAVVLAAGAGGLWLASRPLPSPAPTLTPGSTPSAYQTAVGERTTMILSDGSKVTLNTRSRLEVAYTPTQRNVTLLSGQALFEVAHNAARPFVVTAGSRKVTAVGTAFDIRLDARQVRVTMVEGKVKVEPARPSLLQTIAPSEKHLVAGQELTASNQSAQVQVAKADVAAETSWRQGRVVFEDTPLPEAVAEMNRYAATPILIGDQSLDQYKVNGMFLTAQPLNFVSAIAAYFPVEAQSNAAGATVLTARR